MYKTGGTMHTTIVETICSYKIRGAVHSKGKRTGVKS